MPDCLHLQHVIGSTYATRAACVWYAGHLVDCTCVYVYHNVDCIYGYVYQTVDCIYGYVYQTVDCMYV